MGLFDGLLGLLSHDVGIDLGTANTLVTVRHRGIVISEPSVVAMDTRSKRVLAIGAEAKRMVGRTPANIVAIRPLRDGVISDFDVTEQMIRYFIAKVHERFAQIRRPRVLVGIPSGVTEVEKRAVRDATVNAGARWARLIEEPMAAAIGAGLPVSEPSVVAIDAKTKRVLAVGAEAKRMVGRTPANIIAVRPLRDGVISDFDVTEQMIKYFVDKVHDRVGTIARPRMLLGIPSGVTEVEKRAVRDAALNAGARWAGLIEEPMAAAIGAGLPVSEPSGSLIVDIGGGTTEVAVISLGGIVVSRSIRIGGDEMDQDIVTFARREYNLFLGERTAEDIKIAIGSAYPGEWDAQRVALRGRDLLTGLPRSVEVGADQIREAIEPSVQQIVDTVKDTIEETPPELVADIMDQGIVLAGGGALLAGLDRRVAEATQMPVHIADDPLTCVARGTGVVLQDLDRMQRVLVSETYSRPPR